MIPKRTSEWQNCFPKQFGPLHVSAYWGLDEVSGQLLQHGIDINNLDNYGQTAPQVAAKRGYESIVRLLLQDDASVNIENDSGETALYWAARNGHESIVQLLVAEGASVTTEDNEGWRLLLSEDLDV